MTAPDPAMPPGARFAMSVIHPGPPMLQVRYRQGVIVTPHGYPDWPLCARAVVGLPPPGPRLTLDELRVVDVLAANAAMANVADEPSGDPLWAPPAGRGRAVGTPPGWCWAHVALTRQLALVPVELHGSYRHAGGISTLPPAGRGLRVDPQPVPVAQAPPDPVPKESLDLLERLLGCPLPPVYRRYLAETNGAGPAAPGLLPGHGLIADQPLFGLARKDRSQDLSYVAEWLRYRLTAELLPIGYVQGGLLLVKMSGEDIDSIWYWDDDDPRDRDAYDVEHVRDNLLYRCADSIDAFWTALAQPAQTLVRLAEEWVSAGRVTPVRDDFVGAGLPRRMRAPWQTSPQSGPDPLVTMFEAR
jgi:A nuclease of the HNH/ENDO VII superfamily with conserved WHH/SMI1 / KNR4 family (SUKH-1)